MKRSSRSKKLNGRATDGNVERIVARIIGDVRRRGDEALRSLTRRLDGARRASIEVRKSEWQRGARSVDRATLEALRFARRRIQRFARRQKRSLRPFRATERGVVLEQRLLPVDHVGLYVPGGRYPLSSTVLMAAIPARVAGCRRIVLCTPPARDGSIAPEILAAATEAGVDRVYAVGGAQAIAAMALGTRSIPRVDLIVGPGNLYVAAAKAALAGRVGIDFVAGPTELLVIADRSASPVLVAADLLGQAEHDPRASLHLAAIGRGTSARIRAALRRLSAALPESNRRIARMALDRLGIISCATTEAAVKVANRLAPEHLSVQTATPRRLVPRLNAYGSLFLGAPSAIALGDYVSGPNHVLPTDRAARHTGGLSVLRFLKVVTVQEVRARGLSRLAPAAMKLASLEGLEAHRLSLSVRTDGEPKRAVLFDFDGVLAQTETFHFRAFREILAPLGIRLTRTLYDRRYLAFDDRTALKTMLHDGGRSLPRTALLDLIRRKQRAYARLSGARLRVGRHAAGLLRAVSRRLPVAIVSGAARREIVTALRRGRVDRVVETIVAAEDVRRCKPDPEGYRLALARLGIGCPDGSVAIEDAPGGVRAARAAGLRVIGIAATCRSSVLREAGASAVVRSIDRIVPGDLVGD